MVKFASAVCPIPLVSQSVPEAHSARLGGRRLQAEHGEASAGLWGVRDPSPCPQLSCALSSLVVLGLPPRPRTPFPAAASVLAQDCRS